MIAQLAIIAALAGAVMIGVAEFLRRIPSSALPGVVALVVGAMLFIVVASLFSPRPYNECDGSHQIKWDRGCK